MIAARSTATLYEPELLTADASVKIGRPQTLTFEELPPVLVKAILAIEDRRFFEHNGLGCLGHWASTSQL